MRSIYQVKISSQYLKEETFYLGSLKGAPRLVENNFQGSDQKPILVGIAAAISAGIATHLYRTFKLLYRQNSFPHQRFGQAWINHLQDKGTHYPMEISRQIFYGDRTLATQLIKTNTEWSSDDYL